VDGRGVSGIKSGKSPGEPGAARKKGGKGVQKKKKKKIKIKKKKK